MEVTATGVHPTTEVTTAGPAIAMGGPTMVVTVATVVTVVTAVTAATAATVVTDTAMAYGGKQTQYVTVKLSKCVTSDTELTGICQ